eukprot:TRINITY_DN28713_c0_g1_i1.p5 TRINITY_DN28713_c0_g1~~TRINITY_DN28713_c0_g1_i1.p5  ORF type:complete len:103 (-),score=7.03 TRINITY_DN28713_c0_g1_i1:409-717(-)
MTRCTNSLAARVRTSVPSHLLDNGLAACGAQHHTARGAGISFRGYHNPLPLPKRMARLLLGNVGRSVWCACSAHREAAEQRPPLLGGTDNVARSCFLELGSR